MNTSLFTRADWLRIKWSFAAMAISIMVCLGLFAGLKSLDTKATAALKAARATHQASQQRLDKISQEEATIRSNIDKYKIIKDTGLVGQEDRLQMYEHFAVLRSGFNLFPITPTIGKQALLPIAYGQLDGKKVDKPGRAVSLQVINIDLKLQLLHENDLANLFNGLVGQRELLQPHLCTLESRARSDQNFLRLGQHLTAQCVLTWYSFRLDETKAKPGGSK